MEKYLLVAVEWVAPDTLVSNCGEVAAGSCGEGSSWYYLLSDVMEEVALNTLVSSCGEGRRGEKVEEVAVGSCGEGSSWYYCQLLWRR